MITSIESKAEEGVSVLWNFEEQVLQLKTQSTDGGRPSLKSMKLDTDKKIRAAIEVLHSALSESLTKQDLAYYRSCALSGETPNDDLRPSMCSPHSNTK
jgi:hypothetical protein